MYDKLLPLENKVQHWLDTPVGFLDSELQPTSHLDMALNGSNLANFINQVQLETSKADISCTSFANVIKGSIADETGFSENDPVDIRNITFNSDNTAIYAEIYAKNRKKGYLDISMGLSAPLDGPNYF